MQVLEEKDGHLSHCFYSTKYNATWRTPTHCQAAGEHGLLGMADIHGSQPPLPCLLHPASVSYASILTEPVRQDVPF